MLLVRPPLDYKTEHFIIDDSLIESQYIKLKFSPIPDSVRIIIEKTNGIVGGYQYRIIKVTDINIVDYSDCYVGQYIVLFRINYDANCHAVDSFINIGKLGLILNVQYIHQDQTVEEVIDENLNVEVDSIGWSK